MWIVTEERVDVLTQGGLSFAGIWAGDGDVGAVVDDESVVFDGVEAREAVGEFALCFGSVFGGAFQKGDVFGIELIEFFGVDARPRRVATRNDRHAATFEQVGEECGLLCDIELLHSHIKSVDDDEDFWARRECVVGRAIVCQVVLHRRNDGFGRFGGVECFPDGHHCVFDVVCRRHGKHQCFDLHFFEFLGHDRFVALCEDESRVHCRDDFENAVCGNASDFGGAFIGRVGACGDELVAFAEL